MRLYHYSKHQAKASGILQTTIPEYQGFRFRFQYLWCFRTNEEVKDSKISRRILKLKRRHQVESHINRVYTEVQGWRYKSVKPFWQLDVDATPNEKYQQGNTEQNLKEKLCITEK